MTNLPLILVGGGGHCKSCIDVIEQEGKYAIQGIVDEKEKPGQKILNYPVIGNDSMLRELIDKGNYFLITVGQIKSAAIRVRLFEQLKSAGAKLATVISPTAHVSVHSVLEEGCIVMHGVFINAGAKIGSNVILNTNSVIEHDAEIANHVHISTAAVINGSVKIGKEVFIGSNSILVNNIEIAGKSVIGAGSVVVNSIIKRGTYAGNPCRLIK
jgi:sugar O-acyltransferase (sialic acid O-acetyltransferase NeuD family)